MAILFNPKCSSNPSILSILDMQTCSRLSLYIGIATMTLIIAFVYATQPREAKANDKVNVYHVLAICAIGILIAVILTPIANLMGKRVKESQLIDERGLIGAGVNPVNAKIASFTDQTIRRIGGTTPGTRSAAAAQ
jgi:hypothetical protein